MTSVNGSSYYEDGQKDLPPDAKVRSRKNRNQAEGKYAEREVLLY